MARLSVVMSILLLSGVVYLGWIQGLVMALGQNPSPYVKEFEVPVKGSGPLAITAAEDGTIWFTLDGANGLASFNPKNESFRFYKIPWEPERPAPQYGLEGIVVDKQGTVWFTHGSTDRIGRLDPKTGAIRGLQVSVNATPIGLLFDSLGNLWFTELRGNKIGMVTPEGKVSEYNLPKPLSGPVGLAFDRKGNLWFTQAFGKRVGMFDISTRNIMEFSPPESLALFSPVGIVVDDDGIVWVADHGSNEVVRFNPQDNTWRKYSTSKAPPEIYPVSLPNDIESDRQGYLWIAEHTGNKIARLDRKAGILTEYTIPTFRAISLWLTIDRDGKIWFAEAEGNKIGVVDPSREVTFSISSTKESVSLEAGQEKSISLTVNIKQQTSKMLVLEGFGSSQITFYFEPNQISGDNPGNFGAEVKVKAKSSAEEGPYSIAISLSDGSVRQTLPLTLSVGKVSSQFGNQFWLVIGAVAALVTFLFAFLLSKSKKKVQGRLPQVSLYSEQNDLPIFGFEEK